MAGTSPLANEVQERITAWLSGRLKVGKSVRPGMSDLWFGRVRLIDIHVTELYPQRKEPSDQLGYAYESFLYLAQTLQHVADHLMVVLTISLKDSEAFDVQPPQLDQVGESLSATPPAMYVVERNWFRQMNPQEIHRRPLRWDPIHSRTSEALVSYRISRPLQAAVNGWEFQRAIEVEHYPP